MAKNVMIVYGCGLSGLADAYRKGGTYDEVHEIDGMVAVGLLPDDREMAFSHRILLDHNAAVGRMDFAPPPEIDVANGGLLLIGTNDWRAGAWGRRGRKERGWEGYGQQGGRSALSIARHRVGDGFRATGGKRSRRRTMGKHGLAVYVAERMAIFKSIATDPRWAEQE